MIAHAIEIAALLAATYLLGCVTGYAARLMVRNRHRGPMMMRASGPAPTAIPSPARRLAAIAARERDAHEAFSPIPADLHRPKPLSAPRFGRPDNLRQIKGIGPKTESSLYALGIYHLDQIAAWHPVHIDWLEGRIAIKGRIRREQWVEQAALLATAPAAA